MAIPLGKATGSVGVECGYLVTAGLYKLRLHMLMKGDILADASFQVRWPHISLSLPDDYEAQTVNVQLWILSHANCSALSYRRHLKIKILRFRAEAIAMLARHNNDSTGDVVKSIADGEVVDSKEYTSISTTGTTIDLNCQTFDLDGSYQAVLVSKINHDSPEVIVAESNVMRVTWSGQYSLDYPPGAVFPCSDMTTLVYTHPPCSGTDLIRLYSHHPAVYGSPASPLKNTYVAERKADPAKTKMHFNCSDFSTNASAFCFAYVSISKSQVYYEQRRLCVPARPNSGKLI